MKEPVCIFCRKNIGDGENHQLTDEHIIPRVLGGWLAVPFVCKQCNNDTFGSNFEADLKKNGFIVAALDKLGLQEKKKAYKSAKLSLKFPSKSKKLKAYFDENGKAQFFPQELENGTLLIPEKEAKGILRKKIARYEEEHKIDTKFNIDSYDDYPNNKLIPVDSTDISFIKSSDDAATIFYEKLSKPISFLLPAKISLVLLSDIDYNLTMSKSFDPFREWVLANDDNKFVLLNSNLKGRNPHKINYLPNHFIRYSYREDCLVAIVGIFGIFKYSVFLGKIPDFKSPTLSSILDNYIIFDLHKKEYFLYSGDDESIEKDEDFVEGIARYGLIVNNTNV